MRKERKVDHQQFRQQKQWRDNHLGDSRAIRQPNKSREVQQPVQPATEAEKQKTGNTHKTAL